MSRPTRWHRADAAVLALLAGILYASLARPGTIDCSRLASAWLRESLGVSGSDVIGNVFAYLLLGGALGLAWLQRQGRRIRWTSRLSAGVMAVAGCVVLSVSMETAQACFSGRTSSVVDLIDNTLGAALGWIAAMLLAPVWARVSRALAPGVREQRLLAVVGLALLAWLTARSAPWAPWLNTASPLGTTDISPLRGHWQRALSNPHGLLRDTCQFLAVCLGLSLPWRSRLAACAAIMLGLAMTATAGIIVPRASFSAHTWAALPLAAVLALMLVATSVRTRAALMLAAAIVAIAMFELRAGSGPLQPFSWRLQVLQGNAVQGIQLALFFGWFGLTVMAAGTTLGGPTWLWLCLAPVILTAMEALQTLLPGRTADLSPPLMALAGAAFAAGLLASSTRR
jgi:VanZ family protein